MVRSCCAPVAATGVERNTVGWPPHIVASHDMDMCVSFLFHSLCFVTWLGFYCYPDTRILNQGPTEFDELADLRLSGEGQRARPQGWMQRSNVPSAAERLHLGRAAKDLQRRLEALMETKKMETAKSTNRWQVQKTMQLGEVVSFCLSLQSPPGPPGDKKCAGHGP